MFSSQRGFGVLGFLRFAVFANVSISAGTTHTEAPEHP